MFNFEDLPDTMIMEMLYGFDDDTLFTLCKEPISKKINRLCKSDGDIQRRIYDYSIGKIIETQSLTDAQLATPIYQGVVFDDKLPFEMNRNIAYWARIQANFNLPLSLKNNFLYIIVNHFTMDELYSNIQRAPYRFPDRNELNNFISFLNGFHNQTLSKYELIGYYATFNESTDHDLEELVLEKYNAL